MSIDYIQRDKRDNMRMNNIKVFLKMKNKGWLK